MRYFSEAEVRELLPMSDAIEAMRSAFKALAIGEALNQPRRRLHLQTGAVLHALAGANLQYFGTKIYSTHPKYGAWFTLLLFDAETAKPLAQFEANYLGQIRTGAVSGLATDVLAPWPEVDVGVIGSGFQAESQIRAVASVRKIRSLRVWSRKEDRRQAFAAKVMTQLGIAASAAQTSEEATANAEIVITATNAKEPVISETAVRSDALVLAMGSNDPKRREIPGEIVKRAKLVVDDVEAARIEAGDFLLALREEEWGRVQPLGHFLGSGPAHSVEGRTVFKSVGLGIEDVAAASLVYERAIPA